MKPFKTHLPRGNPFGKRVKTVTPLDFNSILRDRAIPDEKHIKVLKSGYDVVRVIAKDFFPDIPFTGIISYLETVTVGIIKNRGLAFFLKYAKRLRSLVMKRLADDPLINCEGVRMTYDRIPVKLGPWIEFIRTRSQPHIKILLTILCMGRAIKKKVNADYSTIQLPLRDIKLPSQGVVKGFVRDAGLQVSDMSVVPIIRYSSGPMGVAMTSVLAEAQALPEDVISALEVIFRSQTGGEEVIQLIHKIRETDPEEMNRNVDFLEQVQKEPCFRRISQVPDKELKSRVVAMMDYWTQLALKPIHGQLAKMLDGLDRDSMFDQHKLLNSKEFSENDGNTFYSYDLKACSDLLPMRLQHQLMCEIFNEDVAHAWKHLMVGNPFTNPWTEPLVYTNGQPMGAYSSFPAFSLAHHLIFYMVEQKIGKRVHYFLLGDDVVIKGTEAAEAYKATIFDLGMEMQDDKSIISKRGWEFAKKLYIDGTDLSPFPIADLILSGKHYWLMSEVFRQNKGRGWDVDKVEFLNFSYNIFLALNLPKKLAKSCSRKAFNFYNKINIWEPNWDKDLIWRLKRFYPEMNVQCTPKVGTYRLLVMEYSIHASVEAIHQNIVNSVKSLNTFMRRTPFMEWKTKFSSHHPFIEVLHLCVRHLNNLEYKVVSQQRKSLEDYYPRKISWADFTPINSKTILEVTPTKAHVTKVKCHVILNSALKSIMELLDGQRTQALMPDVESDNEQES